MATSRTVTYGALLTTTFENTDKVAHDIITESMPGLYWLSKKSRVKAGGGDHIRRNVAVRFNTDGGSFATGDRITATDQNPVEPAKWEWAQYDKPTIFFTADAKKNAGAEQIIDLGKAKMKQTLNSLKNDMAGDFYKSGGDNKLTGLKAFADVNNYTTDTYGGLSRATYSDWRPYCKGSTVGACYTTTVPTEQLLNAMRFAFITCANKGDNGAPDFALTSIQGFDYLEQRVMNALRVYDTEVGDMGFGGLKFKGMTVMADPYLNTTDGTNQGTSGETMYILNSKTWEWVTLTPDMKNGYETRGPIDLEEQIGKRWDTYFIGQMINSDPRANAVLYGITAVAAS